MISGAGTEEPLATHSVDGASSPLSDGGYLLVVDGTTSRRIRLPRQGVLSAGRDPDTNICLASPSVSRRHAELVVVDGRVSVSDLDSRNGTSVNGLRIEGPRPLNNGDLVCVGDVELVYRAPPPTNERPSPPLAPAELERRLSEELVRMRATERPVGVVALVAPPDSRLELGELSPGLAAQLTGLEVAGRGADGALFVIVPERDRDAVEERAAALLERLLRGAAPSADLRAGYAVAPADGVEAVGLLHLARGAAGSAAAGRAREIATEAWVRQLGERAVVVADPAMVRLYELIRRLARSDLPVLVTGETGTGKEHAAWAVHWQSPRASGPFVSVNCAALTESLLESELFGHERGAFTGAAARKEGRLEAAGGGTLFLDEVGELSPAAQAKLLRVLETHKLTRVGGSAEVPVDIRVVAATHRDLEADVVAGRFRRDLFFRLGAALVALPPLRERPREIALLARRFLEESSGRLGRRPPPRLSTRTLLALARWSWPGNIRELKNLMDFLAATVLEELIEPFHLPETMVQGEAGRVDEGGPPEDRDPPEEDGARSATLRLGSLTESLKAYERRLLTEALAACGGSRARAAAALALPLRTFKYKLRAHGLSGRASSGHVDDGS